MAELQYKTHSNRSPNGLIRTLFIAPEEDFDRYFKEITDQILEISRNIAIYYTRNPEDLPEDVIGSMRLVIVPVTMAFLHPDCRWRTEVFDKARELHIPLLPILKQAGIEPFFNRICAQIQFLDGVTKDETAIAYEDKLKTFLDTVLVDDETMKKIREAFDAYIFLSYRKKDRKYAQQIMHLIHENPFMRDVAIWYDEYLVPGEDFNDSIRDAMLKSKLITLVVTPNLVNEENYVQQIEYPMARKEGKRILPVEAVATDAESMRQQYDGIADAVRAEDKDALSAALSEVFVSEGMKENDDPDHLYFIGLAYLMGIDVEADAGRAVEILKRALVLGNLQAGYQLIDCYMEGRYVRRDYEIAAGIISDMLEMLPGRLSDTKESYLVYANLLERHVKIFTSLGIYDETVAHNEKMVLETVENMAERFPGPENDSILANVRREYLEILSHLPGYEEEKEKICNEIFASYLEYSEKYGYSKFWDIMRLSAEVGRMFGSQWFEVGFKCMEIYAKTEMSDENRLLYRYSALDLWLAYLEEYEECRLTELRKYGKIRDPEEDEKALSHFLSQTEGIAESVAEVAKDLADADEDELREKLMQRYLKTFGTLSMFTREYDAAKNFYLWAYNELKDRYESPKVMLAQIGNLKNLIRLGDTTGDRRLLHMAHWALDDLYDTLYLATGMEVYNNAMMENLERMEEKSIHAKFDE